MALATPSCLLCSLPLAAREMDYHAACRKKFFGKNAIPDIDLTHHTLEALAKDMMKLGLSLAGVQPKLSLKLTQEGKSPRLTIIGAGGDYILKPQTEHFASLPENEQLTMQLARSIASQKDFPVAESALIRLKDGSLAYLTKRFDRLPTGEKLWMEDLAQALDVPTEYKYRSSLEKVATLIRTHSALPGQDILRLYSLWLFCFLVGNADMHLKNFALIETPSGLRMAPAYDLVNTKLAMPEDKEETALTFQGKKSRFTATHFLEEMPNTLGILPKVAQNYVHQNFRKAMPTWRQLVERSFLPSDLKQGYTAVLTQRANTLGWESWLEAS